MQKYAAEIYRQEGDNFRSVGVSVDADGSAQLHAQDIGKPVEDVWGDSDYEFWVQVPSAEICKLAFALLREKYSGRERAVDEFRAFCEREAIEHKWGSYA